MERTDALRTLASTNADDRLRAARYLVRQGLEADVPLLQEAFSKETNRWVKSALRKALLSLRSSNEPIPAEIGVEGEDDRAMEQVHAAAVEETTQRLIHEIRPIIGRLNVWAGKEVPNYDQSRTKAEWTCLQELLAAIEKLGQAASSPVINEFDLAELVEEVVSSPNGEKGPRIEVAGPKPLVIFGSRSLVQLILSNALRNAIEATEEGVSDEPVVVNWGETDRDYWLAVLDRGRGLPSSGSNRVFEIGATTKRGHLGMGLALARQAALTLNGRISLAPRDPKGARLEFRWPRVAV